jgi:hypothetical protein
MDVVGVARLGPGPQNGVGRRCVRRRERVVYLDRTQPLRQQRFTQGHELVHRAVQWHDDPAEPASAAKAGHAVEHNRV